MSNRDIKRDSLESPPPALAPPVTRNIIGKRKVRFAFADATDFTLDTEVVTQDCIPDLSRFAPYAFHYDADAFFLVDTPRAVLNRPFFYLGQFESATTALTVGRDQLLMSLGGRHVVEAKRPTYVFSIGRCGSTLLTQLAGAVGMFPISEPDVFTGIYRHPDDNRFKEILGGGYLALEKYAGVRDELIMIKLRSQSCDSAGRFISTFPKARFVFLKRNLHDWATSFISKFNWPAAVLARTLASGFHAVQRFSAAGVDLTIIDYETMVADPIAVAGRLRGSPLTETERRNIKQVMSTDSQAGAGIRVRRTKAGVQKEVNDFLQGWNRDADTRLKQFYKTKT